MGYSATDVLKQFVKSDGTKCSKLDDIYSYLNGRTYRAPLVMSGANISNGRNIIDVVAIGFDANWLRPNQYDPIVMSLDTLTLANLNLKADTTFAETAPSYFSNSQPLYLNYNNSLLLPGTLIKSADLATCNKYMTTSRSNAYCGARADTSSKIVMKSFDYWSANEKNISNYSRDAANQDKNGVMELNMLFYTTEIVDQLQTRFGYRTMNHLDPYHWSNWLIASTNATVGSGSRYFKLMYLTEFDYYMHGGVMANPSRLDSYLCKSTEFSQAINQIVTPISGLSQSTDGQYYNSNFLPKSSTMAAGQYIYSKDYKYKLHLTHGGNLNVYEFPILNDDITVCKNKVLSSSTWAANADNLLTCYLAVQGDGNIVVAGNPGTSMQYDPNYANVLTTYITTGGWTDGMRNTAIVIIGSFCRANNITAGLQGMGNVPLFKALIAKNALNVATILNPGSKPTENQLTGGMVLVTSGTNGNVYFGMSDYQVLVGSGGAMMAVNAGLSSKIGADQTGYITNSNSTNWIHTNDPMNVQCMHGWKYLNTDGTGIPNTNPISNITMQGDPKSWCYQNPFLIYTDSDGTQYKFGATNMQQILWFVGNYQNNIDATYAFLISGFLQKAGSLGFNQTVSINDNNGQLVMANYCMRGDRWLTNGACKTMALNPGWNAIAPSDAIKRLIDFDIKTRICANPTTSAAQIMCAVINPTGLTDVEASLIKLDPNLVYACSSVSANFGYPDLPGPGVTRTWQDGTYIMSDGTRTNLLQAAIEKNAANLSEVQLLYLRKFYTTIGDTRVMTIQYTPSNTLTYKNDYYTGENVMRTSPNNMFKLIWQADGNLVIYTNDKAQTAVWSSATSMNYSAMLTIDASGSAIIYSDSTRTKVLWSTGTTSKNPVTLAVDNDGNAVLFGMNNMINNIWSPIWTSNGLSTYKVTPVDISPIVNLLDRTKWYVMYQNVMKLAPPAVRTDLDSNIGISSILAYRNVYGTITIQETAIDTNVIRSMGTPLVAKSDIYAPTDVLWKYILGYMNISFPGQSLTPLSVNDLLKQLDPKVAAMLTLATTPFETQIWTMNGTTAANSGNIIVFRIISTAAMINFMRSQGSTFASDSHFKNMCLSNMDACVPEFSDLVSTPGIDLKSTDYNAICDIANLGSGVSQMKNDPNYAIVVKSYTPAAGFGGNRNTAIVIVGKYMNTINVTANPQGFTDTQLYAIMTGQATPSGMLVGYPGILSATNAKAMQATCMNAYGTQKCAAPASRYSAAFTNKNKFGGRSVLKGGSRFNTRVETFSGANCTNICNDPKATPDIQAACKVGALAYCGQSDYIYGSSCAADMTKYPELADIKKNWCAINPTHPNFAKNCPESKAASIIQLAGQAGAAQGNGPAGTAVQQSSGSSGDTTYGGLPWWGWLLIVIAVIMFAGIAAVYMRRKSSSVAIMPKAIPQMEPPLMPPMQQPQMALPMQPMPSMQPMPPMQQQMAPMQQMQQPTYGPAPMYGPAY